MTIILTKKNDLAFLFVFYSWDDVAHTQKCESKVPEMIKAVDELVSHRCRPGQCLVQSVNLR